MTESGQRREVPPEPVRHDALRVAAELTGQVLWSLTPEGELSEDSPSWRAFTGQTLEESRGRGWWDAIHSEDREAAEHAWREARSRAGPCEIEYRVRRPNLRYTRVRMRGLPVLGSEGGRERGSPPAVRSGRTSRSAAARSGFGSRRLRAGWTG